MPENQHYDNAYPVHNQYQEWVGQVTSKETATFDDSYDTWDKAPEAVRALVEEVSKAKPISNIKQDIVATLDSASKQYQYLHGTLPSGGVLAHSVNMALNTIAPRYTKVGQLVDLDSVASTQSDGSMIANRALLGIYQTMVDAIPFAGFVPMTEGLTGKLMVLNHRAGNEVGEYKPNDNLDGIFAGKTFLSHTRTAVASGSGGSFSGQIKLAKDIADNVPILPSTTEVYVNGLLAGGVLVNVDSTTAKASISGTITLPTGSGGEQLHTVGGSITTATGAFELTFTPNLPSGATVEVEASINFEHESMKDKRPLVQTTAVVRDFRASFSSGIYKVSSEAQTQMQVEVGLDATSEGMLALRNQHAAERHFKALKDLYRIGKQYPTNIDMQATVRLNARDRASLWNDVLYGLSQADLAMQIRTNAFGIGVIYVGATGYAHIRALPSEIFTPANVSSSQMGIFRVGRLYQQYEVYFVPNLLQDTSTSAQMLAVGRSHQTALNPYVVGDVLTPVFKQLGVGVNLSEGAGFIHCGAAKVNPFAAAASGAAVINITNLA